MKNINYINSNKERISLELSDEIDNIVEQANKDYEISRKYIQTQFYHIWREWYKKYHMSTYDRRSQIENRQQNISIWLVRAFTDVLISTVQEKPLSHIVTWVNKKWTDNKEAITKTLNYISDITKYHTKLRKSMSTGLITWTISIRVWYKKTKDKEKVVSIINDNYIEETIDIEEMNTPFAESVSIFKVFPDPYTWTLRYITERDVVSYENFIETFWNLIRHKENKSPLKNDDFLKLLWINKNGADYTDYWNILNQIYEKTNTDLSKKDFYLRDDNWRTILNYTSWTTQDQDSQVTEGLVEFKITFYKNRIVLLANNYPVYVWANIYWFIPYVIQPSNESDLRFGEWIPYMIWPLEDVWNSFINNYFDSARSIANPTFVVNKNLLINDEELENWTPWGIIYAEWVDSWNVVYRLDKWGLQDFSILNLIKSIATEITWISEYNLWISAKERTASWALSVSESSIRRMWPYMKNFIDANSIVASMWLKLVKKFWTAEQMIYILDEEWKQTWEAITNKDLTWQVNVSLEANWIFGASNELEFNKLISLYTQLADSGFLNAPEFAKELIKKAWYSPSKYIIQTGQIKPDNWKELQATVKQLWQPWSDLWANIENQLIKEDTDITPTQELGNILWQNANPQIDLWNEWKWNI